jgi:hypothetical protein
MPHQNPRQSSPAGGGGPRRWWRIAQAGEPEQLPFLGFYEELALSAEYDAPGAEIEEEIMQTLRRIADPAVDWQPTQSTWGDDHAFVQNWFEAGEALADQPQPYEAKQPGTDALDRALRWMRSVAVATGLITAH